MRDIIKQLVEEEAFYRIEVKKRVDAIYALRKICKHDKIVDDGHDSHHSYTKCPICGETFED